MTLSGVIPKLTRTTCVDCGLPWPAEGDQSDDSLESRVNEVCKCVLNREITRDIDGVRSRDTQVLAPRFVVEDSEYNSWQDCKESCKDPWLVVPCLICYAVVATVLGFSIFYNE